MNNERRIAPWGSLVGSATLILALFSFGCATASRPSPESSSISLELIDSTAVEIRKTWFERGPAGTVVVAGFVTRQQGAKDTSNVHLDVKGFDAFGNTLIETHGKFRPELIPWRKPPRRGASRYRIELTDFTSAVTTIAVRAHEGPCPLTGVEAPIPENT